MLTALVRASAVLRLRLAPVNASSESLATPTSYSGSRYAEKTNASPTGGSIVHFAGALPDYVDELRSKWKLKADADPDFNKSIHVNHESQILFMVPSKKSEGAFRTAVRETWMDQVGICNANNGPKIGCMMYVLFAYVDSTDREVPSDCSKAKDCVGADGQEGFKHLGEMTISLYRKVLEAYPWATHIGKLDMDTFPHFQRLLPSIPQGKYSLTGNMVDHRGCGSASYCPPEQCSKPIDGNLLNYLFWSGRRHIGVSVHCWSFPQGGLYLLSRDLAVGVFGSKSSKGTIDSCDRRDLGLEDVMVGWSAVEYARTLDVPVFTWPESILKDTGTMFEHLPFA